MQIKFKPQLVRNLQRHFRTLNFPSFKVIFWSLYKKGADKKKERKKGCAAATYTRNGLYGYDEFVPHY